MSLEFSLENRRDRDRPWGGVVLGVGFSFASKGLPDEASRTLLRVLRRWRVEATWKDGELKFGGHFDPNRYSAFVESFFKRFIPIVEAERARNFRKRSLLWFRRTWGTHSFVPFFGDWFACWRCGTKISVLEIYATGGHDFDTLERLGRKRPCLSR